LSFKVGAREHIPNYSDVIKNQFKRVCGNASMKNQEKGKKNQIVFYLA